MGKRGLWVAAAFVLVLGVATPALPSGAHVDKKKCRWVVKKIKGKKKRVRVCTKPKPKPPKPKPPTGGTSVPPPGYFPRPANPLKVSLDLDDAHTAVATIGTAGGSLTTSGATGTRFTLTIPDEALLGDERVTLTPVNSIGSFPFSGLIGAVEIQPHGLQLLRPATLTIEPSGNAPTAGRSGFLAHESGNDFQLYPLGSGGQITMKLTHFSSPGVGTATAGELASVLSRMPVRTQAQYESLIAEQVKKLDGSAQAAAAIEQIAALGAAYYRDIVKPLVDKAISDDSYAIEAVQQLLGWARQLELIGASDHRFVKALHDGVFEKVAIILRNAINKSYARCASHDLSEIVRLISYERQMQLLRLPGGDALGKAERCARFEVDYDTRVTAPLHVVGPAGAGLSCCPYAQVEETAQDVQLTLNDRFQLTGTMQHEPVSRQVFNAFPETCYVASSASTPYSEPLVVRDLGLNFNVRERKLPDGRIVRDVPPPQVAMLMSPGGIQFQWHFVPTTQDPYCSGTQDGAMHSGIPWLLAAEKIDGVGPGGAHFYELVPFVGLNEFGLAWELTDWGAPSGALIGRKTYHFSEPTEDDRIVIAEDTSISLFHRPA